MHRHWIVSVHMHGVVQIHADGEQHGWLWCAGHSLGLTETQHERADVARTFFATNVVTMNGHEVDASKMSDKQAIGAFQEFNRQWRAIAASSADPTRSLDPAQVVAHAGAMTQWGWTGQARYIQARNQLEQAGTHETVQGKIPTEVEARAMIEENGGKVLRVDEPHESPNPHQYPHINYETSSGEKATVRIQPPTQ